MALGTAGRVSIALAVAAALSLGAFLPPVLAEWFSPPLGRFGGAFALLLAALGLAASVALGLVSRRRAFALDLAMLSGLAAVWVGSQVGRQANFPPPPTTPALLAPHIDGLIWPAMVLGFVAAMTWLVGYRTPEPVRVPEANTTIAPQPSPLLTASAPWLWRWSALLTSIGLAVGLVLNVPGWYRFALLEAALVAFAVIALVASRPTPGKARRAVAGTVGWLVVWLLALGVVYFATSEDLEAVMARNTIEYRVVEFCRGVFGDERFATRPSGTLAGTVTSGEGTPLEGAGVVVSTVSGQAYSAYTDSDGRYRIEGVPEGNYLPLAVAAGYRQAPPAGADARVSSVRPGQTTAGVDFRLQPNPPIELSPDAGLQMGQATTSTVEHPAPSEAIRREFSYENGGMRLGGGLVHEPAAELGSGPFPILLVVYPGLAASWEGVSIPLASNGYVVISYFPVRLLDLHGDVDDLRVLLSLAASGQLSERGDPNRIVLVGGSVSTAYTYLMARATERSPIRDRLKGTVQYGGLFDFFTYRYDWEQGKIEIDPGISQLEYLLVAFGRPDTRPELYLYLSPRYSLGPESLPPTFLVHTGNDIIVPVGQSYIADQKLSSLGTDHRLLVYPSLEHYLDVTTSNPAERETQLDMLQETLDFLEASTK